MGRTVQLQTIIIGAGMAGLLAAIKLRERGSDDFVIFEKGDSIGGTWRENRYPGLTCDVPAHAYTYSFAPNPDWSAFYAGGPEIKRYFEGVAERYGLGPFIQFGAEVTSCTYDETTARWTVTLADGRTVSSKVVIAATGVLHHPNVPQIPGLESFEGAAFHSARWDDSVQLDGKRVGVIGNGSTGVQIVTALSERSASVVFSWRAK